MGVTLARAASDMVLWWSPMTVTVLWQSKTSKRTQILDLFAMSRDGLLVRDVMGKANSWKVPRLPKGTCFAWNELQPVSATRYSLGSHSLQPQP